MKNVALPWRRVRMGLNRPSRVPGYGGTCECHGAIRPPLGVPDVGGSSAPAPHYWVFTDRHRCGAGISGITASGMRHAGAVAWHYHL